MRQCVVIGGLIVFPGIGVPVNRDATFVPPPDPRLLKLQTFLCERDSPIQHLAQDFLIAADRYGVDWRLLPAIAMVESSGGKYHPHGNIFGWDNGLEEFSSIHTSIYEIAEKISHMRWYKDKDLDGVLWMYNPVPGYSDRIKNTMRTIDPDFRISRRVMFPSSASRPAPTPRPRPSREPGSRGGSFV